MSWLRRHARLLLAGYAVLLLVALFTPTSGTQNVMVTWVSHLLSDVHAPASWTVFGRLEVVMNAVIVAPLTFLASMVRPSYSWRDWTAFGFVFSGCVELIQGLALAHRHPAFSDVVANTLGALVGALIFAMLVRGPGSRSRVGVGRGRPGAQV